ncbi:MAG TPA: type II toxin-antitoxin system RelE/ParE family toxin [Xanthobacteraceae bacterium]|nr:type II toxin-antitoxin system RelE/ParE family toxin [Xanthobacteraceae bacterium]
MAIRSFKDRRSAILFDGQRPKGFPPDLVRIARRKLRAIDAAVAVRDLVEPPGNRLEKLKGGRAGQWSIRINDQWRVCFVWMDDGAHDVEVVDYH